MSTLKIGMDILAEEKVAIDSDRHGGLFKTPVVGPKCHGCGLHAPVTCVETAGEGAPLRYGVCWRPICIIRPQTNLSGRTLKYPCPCLYGAGRTLGAGKADPSDQDAQPDSAEVERVAVASLA